jgi:DNA topoisomerase-1
MSRRNCSGHVNDYLRTITGADITAKDFRTWAGTVLAARFLAEAGGCESATAAKRNLSAAVKRVAMALGNTPAVCRKSYIHPNLCSTYLDGGLVFEVAEESGTSGLRPDEVALLALLRASGSAL